MNQNQYARATRLKERLPAYLQKIKVKNLSNCGRNITCSCPLHFDGTPSFSASLENDDIWLFMCHSCGVKGSIIDLHAALNGLDPHGDFWVVVKSLEQLWGPAEYEDTVEENDDAKAFAHEWLESNFASLKQAFSLYLCADAWTRALFVKSLGLPEYLLLEMAQRQCLGIVPKRVKLYTNHGREISMPEPRLVYMGRSHLKIRRPFGDERGPRFMIFGHPTEPWCGELLQDQRFLGSTVHFHESETSAMSLMVSGFARADGSSLVASAHSANGFKTEWVPLFKDREVHFWPDANNEGRKFVMKVSAALRGVARKLVLHDWQRYIKVHGLPGHDECKDVRDVYMRAGAEVLRNVPPDEQATSERAEALQYEAVDAVTVGKKMRLVHCRQIQVEKEPDQLVEGLLTERCCSVFYGDSNVGKTFFVLDLAAAVASGKLIAGRKVHQSPVVYVSMEGARRFNYRIVALKETGRLSNDAPFYLASWPLALLEDDKVGEFVNEVLKQIPAGAKPGLIVLDTLSRGMAGGDETSSVDMTTAIAAVDRIRHETGAHCLLVHHSGKDRSKGSRGHTSLRAAIDSEFEISRDGEDVPFVHNTKQRDLPKAADFRFLLRQYRLSIDAAGEDITTCTVEYPGGTPAEGKKHGATKGSAKPPSIDEVCTCLKAEPEQRDIVMHRLVEQLGISERIAKRSIVQALAAQRIREVQVKVRSGQRRLHLCLAEAVARVP